MIATFKNFLGLGCALVMFPSAGSGQSLQQQGIASTTQILDTSILFAIGAREAEQALRGSFGWPTFQEGFVDRVYFRFDPDGYARFSTSPRLDEDVFEIICAESSTACLAKKPSLEVGLTVEGKIQIRIADITAQDTFFVSDRKSELPLPPTILEPLDARLETLLASGGHLIVKREVETVQEISLAGFSAVSTYLRWVAQGQSPRVFPRGWPVPAQMNAQQIGGLTQADAWVAQSTGPQRDQTTFAQVQGNQNTRLQRSQLQPTQANSIGTQLMTSGTVSGDFGQRQQVGTPNMIDSAQETIQTLQRELALLRASKEGLNQPGSAQVADDLAIGFAQQAQARDLHTPVGFGSRIISPNEQEHITIAGNDFAPTTVQSSVPEAIGIDRKTVSSLEARLFALESAVIEMRNAVLLEMRGLKSNFAEPVIAPVPTSPAATVVSVENAPKDMEALEQLLLERLSKRDPLPTIDEAVVDPAPPSEARSERFQIMELLKQLDPAVVEEQDTVHEPNAVAVEQPSSGGFVTLSDYINQVLKAEGQELQKAN
jgi:hypothetical protein